MKWCFAIFVAISLSGVSSIAFANESESMKQLSKASSPKTPGIVEGNQSPDVHSHYVHYSPGAFSAASRLQGAVQRGRYDFYTVPKLGSYGRTEFLRIDTATGRTWLYQHKPKHDPEWVMVDEPSCCSSTEEKSSNSGPFSTEEGGLRMGPSRTDRELPRAWSAP